MDGKGQEELSKGEENWLGARSKLKPMEVGATTIMSDAGTERTDESEGFNNRGQSDNCARHDNKMSDVTAMSEATEAISKKTRSVVSGSG